MAKPYRRQDSPYWWIAPSINGTRVPQSSRTTDYDEALRQLRIIEGKAAANPAITPRTDRGTVGSLLSLVTAHYEENNLASLRSVRWRIRQLQDALGPFEAGKLTKHVLSDYIRRRKAAGAHIATINRELAVLRRAYNLGIESGEVSTKPPIKMLPGEEAQTGFFTEEGFRSCLRHANALLHDVLICLYYTGWRVDSILHLEWTNVDFHRGIVGLRLNQTKNKTATAFPLASFPELRQMLERRYAETKAIEKADRLIITAVFHRQGTPAINITEGWHFCRRKAGLPGRKLHDFRRTAVRNLLAAGYPIPVIKLMVGMRTDSIVYRYAIITEDDVLKYGADHVKKPTLR
jgi:integrase